MRTNFSFHNRKSARKTRCWRWRASSVAMHEAFRPMSPRASPSRRRWSCHFCRWFLSRRYCAGLRTLQRSSLSMIDSESLNFLRINYSLPKSPSTLATSAAWIFLLGIIRDCGFPAEMRALVSVARLSHLGENSQTVGCALLLCLQNNCVII